MLKVRDIALRTAATLATLVLLVSLILVGLFLYVQSDSGRSSLAHLISRSLSSKSFILELESIDTLTTDRISASGIKIGDTEGLWLSLDALDILWNPVALVRGQVHITKLMLSEVLVARIPSFGDGNNSAEGSFSLPLAFKLGQLQSERIFLQQEVLGREVTLRIAGNAEVTDRNQATGKLTVERTDSIEGSVELAIEYDLGTSQLDVNGDVYDGPGGLLSSVHDFQGLNLSLSGTGPINNWIGTTSLVSGTGAEFDADIGFSNTGELPYLSVTGSAAIATLLQASMRELVKSGVRFALEARVDKDNNAVIESGRIYSDAALLEVEGKLSKSQVAIEASAKLTDLGESWLSAQIPGFEAKSLAVLAQANGPINNAAVQLEVIAGALSVAGQNQTPLKMENAVLNLAADFNMGASEFVMPALISSQGRIDRISSRDESLQKILSGPVSFSVNSRVDPQFKSVRLSQVNVSTEWAQIDGQGTIRLKQSQTGIPHGISAINLDLETAVPALAHFNPIAGDRLSGATKIRTDIELSTLTSQMKILLDGVWDQPGLDIPILDAALGNKVEIAGIIKGSVDDRLDISNLKLVSNVTSMEGGLTYFPASQDIQSDFLVQIPELADILNLANDIRGKVNVSVAATGSAGDPAIKAVVNVEDLMVDAISGGMISADLSIDHTISDPSGSMRIAIQQQQIGAAKLGALFRMPEFKQISFSGIKFEALDIRAAGELVIPFTEAPLEGTLTGNISSMASISELIGQDFAGNANFSVSLEEENARQRLLATARINQGEIRTPGSANTVVKTIDVNANLSNPFEFVTGQIEIDTQGLQYNENTIDQLDLRIKPKGFDAADVEISALGTKPEPYELSASGQIERNESNLIANLGILNFRFKQHQVDLEKPVKVSISPTEIAVTDIALIGTDGKLLASGRLSEKAIKADITVQDVPLSLLRVYKQDLAIEGELSGEFEIEGALSSPAGKLRLQADNVRLKEDDSADLNGLAVKLVGTLADNQLRLDAGIDGLTDTEFAVAAAIHLQPGNDNSFPTLSQTAPLNAELTWVGSVREVVEYLSLDQHSLTGNADIKLRLNGRTDAPSIRGFARLREGVYENFETGTLIKDLTLDLDDNKNGVSLSGSGNDGAGGLLRLRGSLDIASGDVQKFPVDLKLELERFMLVRLNQLSASVSGEIDLDGNLSELRLTSRLSTEQVDASLTASSGSQVESLEVIEKNYPNGSRNAVNSSAPGGNLVPVNLELALNMPRRVFLRGGGLDSEWSGNLDVTGTAQNPVVSGALQPRRGVFTFFGKQFSLNTGSVRFNGSAEFDPILNLPFEYRGGDFIANLTISGSASTPKLLLSSRPAMPESEIVSRVLFDRDSGTLTTTQKLQLASALASVRNSNLGVIERTRDRLGLDVLSLNESDSQNATVTAGRYLTERVYLEVGRGADRADSSATVEVEISPNVRLQTGTRGGDSGRVGLQWRWDY